MCYVKWALFIPWFDQFRCWNDEINHHSTHRCLIALEITITTIFYHSQKPVMWIRDVKIGALDGCTSKKNYKFPINISTQILGPFLPNAIQVMRRVSISRFLEFHFDFNLSHLFSSYYVLNTQSSGMNYGTRVHKISKIFNIVYCTVVEFILS
jgi:hypothetical protein